MQIEDTKSIEMKLPITRVFVYYFKLCINLYLNVFCVGVLVFVCVHCAYMHECMPLSVCM